MRPRTLHFKTSILPASSGSGSHFTLRKIYIRAFLKLANFYRAIESLMTHNSGILVTGKWTSAFPDIYSIPEGWTAWGNPKMFIFTLYKIDLKPGSVTKRNSRFPLVFLSSADLLTLWNVGPLYQGQVGKWMDCLLLCRYYKWNITLLTKCNQLHYLPGFFGKIRLIILACYSVLILFERKWSSLLSLNRYQTF